MGLKPAGVDGQLLSEHPFPKSELLRDQSSLTSGAMAPSKPGDRQGLRDGRRSACAPIPTPKRQVVFVGFGVTAPKFGYDDYAGVDVHGKIVAALYGAPPSFPSAPGAHYLRQHVKLRNAAAHGAIGFLTSGAERWKSGRHFRNTVRFYRSPRCAGWMTRACPTMSSRRSRPMPRISSSAARAMFEGVRQILEASARSRGRRQAPGLSAGGHGFDSVVSRYSEVESPNIAAILPGSDPQLEE